MHYYSRHKKTKSNEFFEEEDTSFYLKKVCLIKISKVCAFRKGKYAHPLSNEYSCSFDEFYLDIEDTREWFDDRLDMYYSVNGSMSTSSLSYRTVPSNAEVTRKQNLRKISKL